MANKKISELTKVSASNATDEFVLSRGGANVSIEAQNLTIVSASYALTASYAVSSSVEIKQEISSSFAQTAFSATSASLAQLALEAISSSYSVSSSLVSTSFRDYIFILCGIIFSITTFFRGYIVIICFNSITPIRC